MAIAAVALVVIVGGVFAYQKLVSEPADEKAQTQLTEAMSRMAEVQQMATQAQQLKAMPDSILTQQLQAQGIIPATTTPDSVTILTKQYRETGMKGVTMAADKLLKGEAKFPGLLKLAAGGGNAGNLANYMAGVCYFQLGNYKEAIKYLEAFSPKSDNSISPVAISALANAYAADGQVDKAIAAFNEAADKADNETLTPLYRVEAAKLLESQKKKAEAHAIYVNVKKEYPQYGAQQGMMTSEIDKYIERTK